jgi:non-ribosomal peptide synthetase component F
VVKSYRGAQQSVLPDAAVTAEIKRQAATLGSTVVAFLFAAFQALLYRLSAVGRGGRSGGLDADGGREGSRRHATNFLPIRVRIDGWQPFTTHLAAVKSALLDAQEHQALTFGSLVRRRTSRDPSRTLW